MTCHNELHDGVADLAVKAFTPSCLCDDALIHQVCAVREEKSHSVVSPPKKSPETTGNLEQKGDLITHEICQRGTDSIHDALSREHYRPLSPEQVSREVSSYGIEGEVE